ncbi:MAG: GntR family transcriptional regulator [Desulfomonilia bacterium]
MTFTPSVNLAYQIAQYVSEKIIHAELRPGERIIEDKLARELKVSRIPLREALRFLEKDGLVELTPRRGVRVTILTRSHVEYTYDILTELYDLLIRKLVEVADQECFAQIETAIDQLGQCATAHDVEGYYTATFNFGAIALKFLKAPLLERIISELWPSKRRVEYYITTHRQEDLMENVTLFRQAFQYACAGDAERASLSIRTYMQRQKEFALEHVPLD